MRHFPQNNLHEWVRLTLPIRFRAFCVFLYLPKLSLMVRNRQMIPSVLMRQTPWRTVVFWTRIRALILCLGGGRFSLRTTSINGGLKCCVLAG